MKRGQSLTESGQPGSLGSVATSYVQALLDVAEARGADRQALLLQAGITLPKSDQAAMHVPVGHLLALFDAARDATGDKLIGLRLGCAAKPRMFSALGYAAMGCKTLGEAVSLIPRYEAVVYAGATTTVTLGHHDATIAWRPSFPRADAARMQPLNEAIVAGWLTYGRWITGLQANVKAVRFQHQAPGALDDYRALFGCVPTFGAADNALVFDRGLLELPLIQHDDGLRQLMEQQAQNLLNQLHADRSVSSRVLDAIRLGLPRGDFGSAAIARAMGTSERSLRRQLREEGCNFRALIAQVREELARVYLSDDMLSVLDVALLLGYTEQSAFSAAFRSWTGMSPREFQARQRT
ncbi:MAG TPA: AraC family transcriptional regulator [Paraburkholderia sp.]